MTKIPIDDLSKQLGLAKRHIMRLVYQKNSTLRYDHIDGIKYFDKNEVVEMLKKGGE